MNQKEIFKHLIELAEKLGIEVSEQNLKVSGFNVKSGFCRVKGKDRIIIDKKKTVSEKNQIIGRELAGFNLDDVYMVPVLRVFFDRIRKKGS